MKQVETIPRVGMPDVGIFAPVVTQRRLDLPNLPNATVEEVERGKGLSQVFSMRMKDAVRIFSIPPERIFNISDSRVNYEEAFELFQLVTGLRKQGGAKSQSEEIKVLNLCDGIGGVSHALAKVIPNAWVTSVELDAETHKRAEFNISQAGLSERVELIQGDAISFLENSGRQYDAIFFDAFDWPLDALSTLMPSPRRNVSLTEITPPLAGVMIEAARHAPVIAARVPVNTEQEEIVALGRELGREVHICTFRILEEKGQQTTAVYYVDSGRAQVTVSEHRFNPDPLHKFWEKTILKA